MLRATVALNIRSAAERRGIGLNALADLAGVSRSQLYNVLALASTPTVDWLGSIASALDIPLWRLMKGGR